MILNKMKYKVDDFKAIRALAVTLGVSVPVSNEDVLNSKTINSLNRAAQRVFSELSALYDENKKLKDMVKYGIGYDDLHQDSVESNK